MTVTFGVTATATAAADGGGTVNNGRRVLMAKTDSVSNVNNNNNNNNNGPAPTPSTTGKASVLSVRRVLFGPPADPAETRAWLNQQLYLATAVDSQSWNFDFINERPLRDSPADRYAWERVCPPPAPQQPQREDEAPAANSMADQRNCRRTAAGKQRQSKVTGKNHNRLLSLTIKTYISSPVRFLYCVTPWVDYI